MLKELDLGGTLISEPGLVSLRELLALEHLTLAHTGVTDFGLLHLRDLNTLQCLELAATNISEFRRRQKPILKPPCQRRFGFFFCLPA